MLTARCQQTSWQRAVDCRARPRVATAAAAASLHQTGVAAAGQQPHCRQQQQHKPGSGGLQPARPARRRRPGRRVRAGGSSEPQASSGNGSGISGGGGSNGNSSSGGGGNNGGGSSSSPPGGAGSGDGSVSPSRQALHPAAIAAAAGAGALLVLVANVFWTQLQLVNATNALTEGAEEQSANSAAIRDRIAALKRLLREVFADQLAVKQRLDVLEKGAAAAPEAADDFRLQGASRSASSSSSWPRAPVRACGVFSAAGVLPWSQEASREDALALLSALGATGQADGRLLLHSVLAGGKRRLTAELGQAAMTAECGPVLQLQRLLYRVQASDWLQLMIAPLGGGLDALGRAVTPVRGDFGCTQALLQGHQLSALDVRGSGKAVCVTSGCFSAAGGLFVGGAGKSGVAHLQLQGREGHSLSLLAASTRLGSGRADGADGGSSGMRFLGAQAPQRHLHPSCARGSPPAGSSTVGLAGVVPLGEAVTVTAWAERPRGGRPGWGVGVYSQPDEQGLELGMVLGQPSSAQHAAPREPQAAPLFCELSAKLPLGQGLHVSPGALLSVRGGAASLAYVMQSGWRF